MLCRMFSGNFKMETCNSNNEFFIDRDGIYFRYILNYLRDGMKVAFPHRLAERWRQSTHCP